MTDRMAQHTRGVTSGGNLSRAVLRSQARRLAASSVFFAGHQGGEALIPLLIGVIIDRAVAGGHVPALLGWLAVLAAVFAALSVSWRLGLRRAQLAGLRVAQQLQLDVVSRVVAPAGHAGGDRLPGDLVNVATEDALRVRRVCFGLPPAVSALVGIAVAGAALLWSSVILGLVVLVGAPGLLVVLRVLSRPLERRSGDEQHRAGQASGVAADLIAGLRVLKGAGAEDQARRRYHTVSQSSLAATLGATRAQARYKGAFLSLNGLFLAVVALVGGLLALRGRISPGEFVAAVGLAQYLVAPLQVLGWFSGVAARGRASAQRLAAVLSAPSAVTAGTKELPRPVRGELRLDGVAAGSLAGLHLTVGAGELLGVVAEPEDAASLLGCVGRDADLEAGAVYLDGVALADLDPAEVRSAILVTHHHATLFEGGLLDNVAVATAAGTDVDAAMAAARADEVAQALPHGRESSLDEAGRSLSGGQRQRVVLARSLAADPAVLVLHDPTTAIDAVTEAAIADGISRLRQGRTTILLTTSPALLAVADRVAMVQDGVVTAEGTHVGLAASHEAYRRMVLA
jgi:putative ABC transport system ATP-binding protein